MSKTEPKQSPEQMRIAHNAVMAANAFHNHVLTVLRDEGPDGFRHYRCGTPDGSVVCRFDVILWPGRMLVVGDMGECLWERTYDMLEWARSAVNSIDYFAEKVPHSIPTEEFDPDVARRAVEDLLADRISDMEDADADEADDDSEIQDELREILDGEIECRDLFYQRLYDSGAIDGCSMPSAMNFNHNFLWCRQCVIWLLAHLPSAPSP